MKIAIVGFGKMGHIIRDTALRYGHDVVVALDPYPTDGAKYIAADGDGSDLCSLVKDSGAEGVIEFSNPSCVVRNITALIPLGLPMVVGTTGWLDKEADIADRLKGNKATIVRSSNFSIGVNVFCKIVEEAARLISAYPEYDVATWEMHHKEKADSPSGTALEIARRITESYKDKTQLVKDAFHERPLATQLHVSSTRCGATPGTHTVFFDSAADTIELTHRARSREGFAIGAVRALERLKAALDKGALSPGALYALDDVL